jgi:heat shock protein HtpX
MWELIRINKRNSVILLAVMALILLALGFVVAAAIGGDPSIGFLGILVAVVIWMVMLLTSYYGGSQILLASSKAQKVTHDIHPQLFNVVEEMKIAANLPQMPDIYIINDPGLNAFATGRDPEHAAVAITAGLLGRLNRDELQGVMAHEISHILHRDILFVTLAGVALGAIVLISQVFLRGMLYGGGRSRYSSSRKGGGQAQLVMLVVALLCAVLAPLFAQLLYFALSRKREYLADAGAARLTRYPEGLANALEKLGQYGPQVASANQATAPMYIVNPLQKKVDVSAWTSTHPPLKDRISILRRMTHGVSFQDYAHSYAEVTHDKNPIPAAALKESTPEPVRSPQKSEPAKVSAQRQMRQLGDLRHRLNNFIFLTCACDLKLKVPSSYQNRTLKCPRCHRVLPVPAGINKTNTGN